MSRIDVVGASCILIDLVMHRLIRSVVLQSAKWDGGRAWYVVLPAGKMEQNRKSR